MGKGDVSWRAVRLESLALLVLLVIVYWQRDAGWLLFAALFLAPDLAALGYLAGPRIGAIGYNLGHSLVGPVALGALGLLAATPLPVTLALIWAAHIAFDRAIGYGLKDAGASWPGRPESANKPGRDLLAPASPAD
jgi:hypothetical protein